jgi:hypothetical protein
VLSHDLTGTSTQLAKNQVVGIPVYHLNVTGEKHMRTIPQRTNRQASSAQLTRQNRLQIALALHTPVERNAQTLQYQELSEDELFQHADALLQALQARTIFLEGEILSKEGFAQAVQEHYATIYHGMVAAHQFVGHLSEEQSQEA